MIFSKPLVFVALLSKVACTNPPSAYQDNALVYDAANADAAKTDGYGCQECILAGKIFVLKSDASGQPWHDWFSVID